MKTFSDIYNAVLRRAKIPVSDTTTLTAVKEFINTAYHEIASEGKWWWLRDQRDIIIPAKYTTGTVSVTNGSRTVTGTGTTWTEDFNGRFFFIEGDDEHYQIISRNSNTQIQLSTNYVGTTNATANYTIYKARYGLFPDLEKIEDIWQDHYRRPLKPIGPRQMTYLINQYKEVEGKAQAYTKDGYKPYDNLNLGDIVLGYDFLGSPDSQSIRIFPGIDNEDYVLHVRYTKRITELVNDTDEPLIPIGNRPILLYGALASLFSMQRNEQSFTLWQSKYEKELREMEGDRDADDDYPEFNYVDVYRNKGRYSDFPIDFSYWWERGIWDIDL